MIVHPGSKQLLIEARNLGKSFGTPGKSLYTVLDTINLQVRAGEYIALLGRSGSGKSTLLRILAGLIPPSTGGVFTEGRSLSGPNPDVAMVFQSFALLPWLTVLENVELGLEARRVAPADRRKRALKAIDMVGLDGFESAYPKELSGGMKQRVGFARAFVMNPKVLFMDEPFSALDVLTAENLRSEIADLWQSGEFIAESIVMVTHNIEEAVMLADRVIILGANPGKIRGEVPIRISHPRDRSSNEFKRLTDAIYRIMTSPDLSVPDVLHDLRSGETVPVRSLPRARAGAIGGLLQLVAEQRGETSVSDLAKVLSIPVDDLLDIVDACVILGFADTFDGRIRLRKAGLTFAESEILESKKIFREQVLEHVPMIRTMVGTLQTKRNHQMDAEFFVDLLDEHFPREEAERQFETAVDWSRFAELFEFDSNSHTLFIPLGGDGSEEVTNEVDES